MTINKCGFNTLGNDPLGIILRSLLPPELAKVKSVSKRLLKLIEEEPKYEYLRKAGSWYVQWNQLKLRPVNPFVSLPLLRSMTGFQFCHPDLYVDAADDKSVMCRGQYDETYDRQQGILHFSDLAGNHSSLLLNASKTETPTLQPIGQSIHDPLVIYATPFPRSYGFATSQHKAVVVNSQTKEIVKELTIFIQRTIHGTTPHVIMRAFFIEKELYVITNRGNLYRFNAKTYELVSKKNENILPEKDQELSSIVAVRYLNPYLIIYHYSNNRYCLSYFSLKDNKTGEIYKSTKEIHLDINSKSLFFIGHEGGQYNLYKINVEQIGSAQDPEWVLTELEIGFGIFNKLKRGKNLTVSERYVAVSGNNTRLTNASVEDTLNHIISPASIATVLDASQKKPVELLRYTNKKFVTEMPIQLHDDALVIKDSRKSFFFRHIPTGYSTQIESETQDGLPFIHEKNGQRTIVLITGESDRKNRNFKVQAITSPVLAPRSQTGIPLPPKPFSPPKPLSPLYRFIRWIRSTSLAQMIWKIVQYIKENGPKCFCCKKTRKLTI